MGLAFAQSSAASQIVAVNAVMSGPASAPSLSLDSECRVSADRTKSAAWNCLTPARSGGVTRIDTLRLARGLLVRMQSMRVDGEQSKI